MDENNSHSLENNPQDPPENSFSCEVIFSSMKDEDDIYKDASEDEPSVGQVEDNSLVMELGRKKSEDYISSGNRTIGSSPHSTTSDCDVPGSADYDRCNENEEATTEDNLTPVESKDETEIVPAPYKPTPTKHPLTYKFTPLVELKNISELSKINCHLLLKLSHANETSLASQLTSMALLNRHPPNTIPLTWNRFRYGLGICYAAANRKSSPPIFLTTTNNVPPGKRMSQNDLNILRCLGTKIVVSPSSSGTFDGEAYVFCRKGTSTFQSPVVKGLCDQLGKINVDVLRLTDNMYDALLEEEFIQPIFEILRQTGATFSMIVCDVETTEILLRSTVHRELIAGYYIVSVEEDHPYANNMTVLLDKDLNHPENLFRVKIGRDVARAHQYLALHEEGLLCSVKSGLLMAGAVVAVRKLGLEGKECSKVTILQPEGILHDTCPESLEYDWLVAKNVWSEEVMEKHCWWWNVAVHDLGLYPIGIIYASMPINEAITFMKNLGVDRVGVNLGQVGSHELAGVVFLSTLESISDKETMISEIMSTYLAYGDLNSLKMCQISNLLTQAEYLVVTLSFEQYSVAANPDEGSTREVTRVVGIVSSEDLIIYKNSIFLEHLRKGHILKG